MMPKLLAIVATLSALVGCTVEDWPYYAAYMPGGVTIEGSRFMRGTWGDEVRFPIAEDAELSARSICYPREQDGNQPCRISVSLIHPGPGGISFEGGAFIARDPDDPETRFDGRWVKCRYDGDCFISPTLPTQESVGIDLSYERPPELFELIVPLVKLSGRTYAIPPISFRYEDTFPYQIVPLLANY